LEVAKENARQQETAIHFLHHDILQQNNLLPRNFPGNEVSDLVIVSNPPYITEDERSSLAKNVIDFEPLIGLFVNDEDPLKFYRAIVRFASHYANTREIYFEINPAYAENVSRLLHEAGFINTSIKEDMQGKKRMVKGAIS
jgi:release factor glutamine methyltransferase